MRTKVCFLGAVALAFLVFAPARAGADTISITSGFLDWPTSSGAATLVLNGTGGFAFNTTVSPAGGVFTPINFCNGSEECQAGTSVSLFAHWVGNDITGSVTYLGNSYDVGGFNSLANLSVTFDGSFVVPAGTGTLTATAPFVFSGIFFHGVQTPMNGSGTATISLAPVPFNPSAFRITQARYDFAAQPMATPEPASMMLLGLGLAGAAVVRRRAKK